VSRYRSSQAEQATYPVTLLCRVLGVARSGYDAWARRGVSARATADRESTTQIAQIHEQSRHTYGAPRIHAALQAGGVRCGSRRVARLMRAAGLVGCHRRRRARTAIADSTAVPAPNLVARDFAAPALNRLWSGDSTYVPTWAGGLYLAVLLDAHSRRVIGWAMAEHLLRRAGPRGPLDGAREPTTSSRPHPPYRSGRSVHGGRLPGGTRRAHHHRLHEPHRRL